jgi:hypothetical protein
MIATEQALYFQQTFPNHFLVSNHTEKFPLPKFAASLMAQAGASSPEFMGRQRRDLTVHCSLSHDAP